MYEKAVRAVAKQRVALEVLSYHASAPPEDVVRIKVRYYGDFKKLKSRMYTKKPSFSIKIQRNN